jgi:transketolase
MRKQFKQTLLDLAQRDDRITVVLGDVSVYLLNEFQKLYPRRFYNLGICENTLISVAAGMSAQGFIPFVHTIAPFLTERSYEQIKVDLCYNQFGANIVTCGATFDYAWDGATHHAYSDLAILRLLP